MIKGNSAWDRSTCALSQFVAGLADEGDQGSTVHIPRSHIAVTTPHGVSAVSEPLIWGSSGQSDLGKFRSMAQ